MKKVFFLFLFSPLLFLLSCNGEDLDPGSTNPAEMTIDVFGYMDGNSVCSFGAEGVLRDVEVRIAVDRYTGGGVFDQNFRNYRFYVHNDVSGNEEDYEFLVEVPETGSYAFEVEMDGDECFNCCNGNSCGFNGGRPAWRVMSAVLNQFPPPPTINLSPVDNIGCF